jgi:hypothetical protein
MKRLALLLAAVAVLLPAAAHAVACSPLDCAPSQFTLDNGKLLAVRASVQSPVRVIDLANGATKWRLPAGIVQGTTLVHQDGRRLTWYDAATGARTGTATFEQPGAYRLVGVSQAGTTAVLARAQKLSTTFLLRSQTSSRTVTLDGNVWMFDALSGPSLYLIETGPSGYYVRLYDLRTGTLRTEPLKDPGDGALIQGVPFGRVSMPDGRNLITLYVSGDGHAMIHDLDLVSAQAHCIDLPGSNSAAAPAWALVPDPDGRQLWAINPGYGKVVAIDVPSHNVRQTWEFDSQGFDQFASAAAVLSPDGAHFALTDSQHLWFLTVASKLTAHRVERGAMAIGWAPDQKALWLAGKDGVVSRLQPLW